MRRRRRKYLTVVLGALALALVLAETNVAEADSPGSPDAARAEFHLKRAKAARARGLWDTTAAEYGMAYKFDPQAKYLFNIGMARELAGKPAMALDAFRKYLNLDPQGKYAATAMAKAKALERTLAEASRKALAAKVAATVKRARDYRRDGRHDAAAFEYRAVYDLTKDGEYLFEAAESYRTSGDRGRAAKTFKHYLRLAPNGKFARSATLRLDELTAQGKHDKKPTPAGVKSSAVKKPSAVRTQPANATAVGAAHVASDKSSTGRGRRILGLSVGAGGIVVAGLGLGLALSAKASWQAAFDDGLCDQETNSCSPVGQEQTDSARSRGNMSTVFVAAGSAALVGGLVLYLTAPKQEKRSRGRGRRILGLTVGAGGIVVAGLGLGLGLSAKASWQAAFDDGLCTQETNTCSPNGKEQTDGARSRGNTATVLVATGSAALVGGLLVYLSAPKQENRSRLTVNAMRGSGSWGVAVTGGF